MRIRYFIVGEYGDKTWRPHYHVILFGLPRPEEIELSWPYGFVQVGFVTPESCAYTAGYTVKRMTDKDDPRLCGRAPEFARMSLRPGIGAFITEEIGKVVLDEKTGELRLPDGDVPSVVRSGGKLWPLGRYLRSRIRGERGLRTVGEGARNRRARELQESLLVPGFRELREKEREQHALNAKTRLQVIRSKKGVGL